MNFKFTKILKIYFLSSLFISPNFAETNFTIAVESIIEEFESNSIVAEEKFLKKKITLTDGEISSVDDSLISDNFVSVIIKPSGEEYSFNSVLCSHKRNETIIRILRKGMKVRVTGILDSESTGLTFTNCSYESYALTQKSKTLVMEGTAKGKLKEYEGAISDFTKAIEINPQNHQAYFYRGTAKGKLKEYEGAISDFTKAIEINPQFYQAYFYRGIAKGDLKEYEGAISDFTKTIEINPQFYQAYFYRGSVKGDLKEYEGAISDFTKTIEINPQFHQAYFYRGRVKGDLKEYEGAISDLTKAENIKPSANTANQIGHYYFQLKDYNNSLAYFEKAISLITDNTSTRLKAILYSNRGESKIILGSVEEGIIDLNKSIKIDPDFNSSYEYRGIGYFKLDNQDQACKDFKKAISIGSDIDQKYLNYCGY